jgi:6-phosphofructokinase
MSVLTFKPSEFQRIRQQYIPALPNGLKSVNSTFSFTKLEVLPEIKEKYPRISEINYVEFQPTDEVSTAEVSPLRIGVVLSGGQAPGGHNVIMGVYDFIKRHHPSSQVFGFLGGPKGIYTNSFKEIDNDLMLVYRNQGGFDMICSGRDKIETEEQYANSLKYSTALNLNGLIVIGGDDSNTNAAILAEYFLKNNSPIKVIGCPKTIDGDLKNEYIEISFGFDTAVKTYSELIGNVCLDAVSTKKYYHFVRLMGRSASHIALECELQTRANFVLIGEEIQAKNQTLSSIVTELADMIYKRGHELGKGYGVVLVPEGLIEFIPEVNQLIKELNDLMAHPTGTEEEIRTHIIQSLSQPSAELFKFLPDSISNQLLLDRDPHGNVQVAKIETERLLIILLENELSNRGYSLPFLAQSYYFGYEGRSCLPSNFDSTYCYALGYTAGSLIKYGFTGCMAVCRDLTLPSEKWRSAGCPLATMMNIERRKGKEVAVIKKALVELDSDFFKSYEKIREFWKYNDSYRVPGPIQFDGIGAYSYTYMLKAPTESELAAPNESSESYPYYYRLPENFSPLMQQRVKADVVLPDILTKPHSVSLASVIESEFEETNYAIATQLPNLADNKLRKYAELQESKELGGPVNIGIVFLGRQAPGAHNVIDGILLATEKTGGKIYGFLGGNIGLLQQSYFLITRENFYPYRNTGGMDFLGRIGDSIRGEEQFEKVRATCKSLSLDGLIIIGATHALTDAAYISEYFLAHNEKTKVIGVPLSVDNNISHSLFEVTLGFDTASRVNAELVGNMMTDSASATKYYYFIRLMGRDPSHLALECALQTHPNIIIVSEFHKNEGDTLVDIVKQISDLVQERAKIGKLFGTLLVPEGLIQQLSHFRELISEINALMGSKSRTERENLGKQIVKNPDLIDEFFHHYSAPVLRNLPDWFQLQLLTRIDSNGQVQLSLIETERLLADLVSSELKERKKLGTFKSAFSPVCHFFGYQGRCSFPSDFDCSLGSTYGATSIALIRAGLTGYITTARGLSGDVSQWRLGGIPITSLTQLKAKSQYGRNKAIVPSSDVNLYSKAYIKATSESKNWALEEHYSNPGPIQFFNSAKDFKNLTLGINHQGYMKSLQEIQEVCARILNVCRFGVHEDLLKTAVIGLTSVEEILNLHKNFR